MSLHLEFEPHSWYMGFAIQDYLGQDHPRLKNPNTGEAISMRWRAYTDNGNTYRVDELEADTLKNLKRQIKEYRGKL